MAPSEELEPGTGFEVEEELDHGAALELAGELVAPLLCARRGASSLSSSSRSFLLVLPDLRRLLREGASLGAATEDSPATKNHHLRKALGLTTNE
jgi:hypothetical protein